MALTTGLRAPGCPRAATASPRAWSPHPQHPGGSPVSAATARERFLLRGRPPLPASSRPRRATGRSCNRRCATCTCRRTRTRATSGVTGAAGCGLHGERGAPAAAALRDCARAPPAGGDGAGRGEGRGQAGHEAAGPARCTSPPPRAPPRGAPPLPAPPRSPPPRLPRPPPRPSPPSRTRTARRQEPRGCVCPARRPPPPAGRPRLYHRVRFAPTGRSSRPPTR